MSWEELLGSREDLRRRVSTIAAVHGWEARSVRSARGSQKSGKGGGKKSKTP